MYILYKTTNLIDGKIYVGIHEQEQPFEFDGYLGSGKHLLRAIKKYGYDSFVRETVLAYDCIEECRIAEAIVVDEVFINRDDTYNMTTGGGYPPKTTLSSGRKAYQTRVKEGKQSKPPTHYGKDHPNYGGFVWITDGTKDKHIKKSMSIPQGWRAGRTRGLRDTRNNLGRFV